MKVLVIGRGGRESAIVWKLSKSKVVDKIYCATGNAGIGMDAQLVPIVAENIEAMADFVEKEQIDLTVVGGPEIALTKGIVDLFQKRGLSILGPSQKASQLEASKVYARDFMKKYKIPTARFGYFDSIEEAHKYIDEVGAPFAIKTDGITGGKGFIIAKDNSTAKIAVHVMMKDQTFGEAGNVIIIEELLTGIDVSIFAFTDGENIKPMVSAKQFLAAYDGNKGPNTGGMGAISPAPPVDDIVRRQIYEDILLPTLDGLKKEGINYQGILYLHIVCTDNGPKVVDFHLRFGDPETQVIMPRLDSDLGEIFLAMKEKRLKEMDIKWNKKYTTAVVAVSGGYPMKYEIGKPIKGLDKKIETKDGIILHAGTKYINDKLVTAGGRVFNAIGFGNNYEESRKNAYKLLKKVSFPEMHYRKDIGPAAIAANYNL